ncbi:hypothetical protein [Providencia heimbachae]|uniref:hypothetical protein n=1 Tax=Providencia heimbachae TaxID=333962 RepID=UPI00223EE523|nr:hypothetical protein [Providencia heimbachae]
MMDEQDDLIKHLPWTGAALKVALVMTVETMTLTPEEAYSQNINVVVGPFAKPYREIMAIAEEYGGREIPRSMHDMPLDIK